VHLALSIFAISSPFSSNTHSSAGTTSVTVAVLKLHLLLLTYSTLYSFCLFLNNSSVTVTTHSVLHCDHRLCKSLWSSAAGSSVMEMWIQSGLSP
jgi:hypothetical protein